MAKLFQTTPQNITLHLKAIFEGGELDEGPTCKDYLQVGIKVWHGVGQGRVLHPRFYLFGLSRARRQLQNGMK